MGDTVTFDYFQLDGPDPSECECVQGPGDEFTGTSLDKSRWNAIVADDPTKYAVGNGALTVTTTAGEIYQGGTGGGPILLQAADHAGADWVLETKLTNTLDGGYSQGGMMAYGSNDDYVKINAISDDGQGRVNRLELRSEVGGTVTQDGGGSADHGRAGGRADLAAADQGREHVLGRSTRSPRPASGWPSRAGHERDGRAEVRPLHARRPAVRRHRHVRVLLGQRRRRAARRPSPRTPRR